MRRIDAPLAPACGGHGAHAASSVPSRPIPAGSSGTSAPQYGPSHWRRLPRTPARPDCSSPRDRACNVPPSAAGARPRRSRKGVGASSADSSRLHGRVGERGGDAGRLHDRPRSIWSAPAAHMAADARKIAVDEMHHALLATSLVAEIAALSGVTPVAVRRPAFILQLERIFRPKRMRSVGARSLLFRSRFGNADHRDPLAGSQGCPGNAGRSADAARSRRGRDAPSCILRGRPDAGLATVASARAGADRPTATGVHFPVHDARPLGACGGARPSRTWKAGDRPLEGKRPTRRSGSTEPPPMALV